VRYFLAVMHVTLCCSCSSLMFCVYSVQEFMDFTSKILVEKTDEGQRTSVGEKG